MIAEQILDFDGLAVMDNGKLNIALRNLMRVLAADCNDRPGDKKARTLTIKISAKPETDQSGIAETVKYTVAFSSKVPTYQSREYQAAIRQNGFGFNVDFPDQLNAQPLPGMGRAGDDK
jgi:hypothetical protein